MDSELIFDNHMIKTDKNKAGQNKTKMNPYNCAYRNILPPKEDSGPTLHEAKPNPVSVSSY